MSNDSLMVAGLWTPIDASGAGLVLVPQATGCFYRKIGDLCFCFFDFAFPVNADGTNALVGGLPLLSRNTPNAVGAGVFGQNGSGVSLDIVVVPASTTFSMRNAVSNATVTNLIMSNVTIRGIMTYPLP